jgi:exopolysaccharide transport family protein
MDENNQSLIEEIHLRDYLRVIMKRRWTIISCFLIVFISTAVFTFTATPIFQGTARLIIEKDNPNVLSIEEVMAVDSSGTDYYQTQYKIIESRSLARKVIDSMGLQDSEEFFPKPEQGALADMTRTVKETVQGWKTQLQELLRTGANPIPDGLSEDAIDSKLVDDFLERVTVEPIRNSRLVNISFNAKDPVLAAKVANTLGKAYIDQNLETKLKAAQDAVAWLNTRIQEERKKVEAAEFKLQKYKEKHGIITDFSNDSESITAQGLSELNSKAIEAESRRVEAQTRYEQTRRLADNPGMLDSIPEILDNILIGSIKQSEVDLNKRLSELSKKYGAKHPQIIAIKAELRTLSRQKAAEIRKVVNSLKNEYEVALAREKSIKNALDKLKAESLDLNKKAITFGVLKREAESSRQMYDLLIKRFKETSLTEDIKTGNIRFVDRAETPRHPIKPKKKLNLLLGLIVGLTLGVGLAFFIEYLDNTIKSPDDIKRLLSIPYLAPIPMFDTANAEYEVPEAVAMNEPKSTASESYRGLRTSLLFSSAEHQPQVILVTSSGPGEGKTGTSLNLGITMAQAGSRVLLIDADLRRPRLHNALKVGREEGISNILAGADDVSKYIVKSPVEGLDVITAGPVPPNPSELLGSNRMVTLLQGLRGRYDRIIIDSPPVTAVTDATILAGMVDGTVLVIRAAHTTREQAKAAIEALKKVGSRLYGAVLNAVNIDKESYYYYQYYYYYYYGEDNKRGKRRKS